MLQALINKINEEILDEVRQDLMFQVMCVVAKMINDGSVTFPDDEFIEELYSKNMKPHLRSWFVMELSEIRGN